MATGRLKRSLRAWLPGRDRLFYASGALGFNIYHQTLTLWLVYFLAPPPEAGRTGYLPVALIGMLLAAGRVIEAFDDPAIGHWSDSTRSRWGRRLPFIVGGTPFLLLAFVLLWSPPRLDLPWGAIVIFLIVQVYFFFASLVHQPYEAVLAEITRSSVERVRVSSWKVAFGLVGAAIGLVGSGLLIGSIGFLGMAIVLGVIGAISISVSAFGVRRLPHAPAQSETLSLWAGLRLTATNRQFLVYVCSEVLFYLGLNMLTGLVPYLVTVVLGQPEGSVALFTGLFAVVSLLSLPGVNWLAARRTKSFAYSAAMAVLVVLLPGLFFVGQIPGVPAVAQGLVYIALLGMPMAALLALPNPIIGDIVDDDELRTGRRREGVYYGVEETLSKFGFALSILIFGAVLSTFGFSSADPLGIRLIGPIAGLGVLIGLIVFRAGYRLPDRITDA